MNRENLKEKQYDILSLQKLNRPVSGVKVELTAKVNWINETLTRIGIINRDKKVITPTCYLYKENDDYYICHFKELLSMFDEIPDKLSEKDSNRRNSICTMLENWGLISIIDTGVYQETLAEKIIVLRHDEKKYYEINNKFSNFAALHKLREMLI